MKWLAALMVLPIDAFEWCETNARTGCVGRKKKFTRVMSEGGNPFTAIPVTGFDSTIVVDWDGDGDLDVLVSNAHGEAGGDLRYFEKQISGEYIELAGAENPFKGISCTDLSTPAVVDWDGDGKLDVIASGWSIEGTTTPLRFFQRQSDGSLLQKTGYENPFASIAGEAAIGVQLTAGDWDGDGDADLVLAHVTTGIAYYEQRAGVAVQVNNSNLAWLAEYNYMPKMVDCDLDGEMDLFLLPNVMRTVSLHGANASNGEMDLFLLPNVWTASLHGANASNRVAGKVLVLSQKDGRVNWLDPDPFREVEFYGAGCSFLDVDGDRQTDAVCGGKNRLDLWLHDHGLLRRVNSSTLPLQAVDVSKLVSPRPGNYVLYFPVLADWDGDGDVDLLLHDGRPLDGNPSRFFENLGQNQVIEVHSPFQNMTCPVLIDRGFSMADWDADGLLDLIGYTWGWEYDSDSVAICRQVNGSFEVINDHTYRGIKSFFELPSMVDWDNDGDLDLLVVMHHDVHWFEQLDGSKGSFVERRLSVGPVSHYSVADFDGDGDLDLLTVALSSKEARFYERMEDGSLEQASQERNPFLGMVTSETFNAFGLGDWDGDGQTDVIQVTDRDIRHYKQDFDEGFVESQSPFRMISSGVLGSYADFKDVDGDGDPDLVLTGPDHTSVRYFEHIGEGLVERFEDENPFHSAYLNTFGRRLVLGDVDGDGDLDLVQGLMGGGISYFQQKAGKFVEVEGAENPFEGISSGPESRLPSCPTLIDFDGDGDLDMALGGTRGYLEYYEQVNQSFRKHEESPFRNVSFLQVLGLPAEQVENFLAALRDPSNLPPQLQFYAQLLQPQIARIAGDLCSSFADVDGDGDLDLLVTDLTNDAFGPSFIYFEQRDGGFVRGNQVVNASLGTLRHPTLTDWDGDGFMDLIVAGGANKKTSSIQYFTRSACYPTSQAFCKLGTCDHQTAQCDCFAGVEGSECARCSKFHFKEEGKCMACPGHGSMMGTCNRRGVCEDDEEARGRVNSSDFEVLSARGSGECRCLAPFHGPGCAEGNCSAGHFLEEDAQVANVSQWYRHWDACRACAPGSSKALPGNGACELCEAGRYQAKAGQLSCDACPAGRSSRAGAAKCFACPKRGTFAEEGSPSCDLCPNGHVTSSDQSECVRCGHGSYPNTNRTECITCPSGFVAESGSGSCSPCAMGSAPGEEGRRCMACATGTYAPERSARCSACPENSVPDAQSGGCNPCEGQLYAMPGDGECRACHFPYMVTQENRCSLLYFFVILLVLLVAALLAYLLGGFLRLWRLKSHLRELEEAHEYEELHSTKASYLSYGMWQGSAQRVIAERKERLEEDSRKLGISLSFALSELPGLYVQKSQDTLWRHYQYGPTTESGFKVAVRGRDPETGGCTWESLNEVAAPENPNFHQLAPLLAYGPDALGKGKICPRDGRPDCSLVDALRKEGKSGAANWFMSWAWGYSLQDVTGALGRWWATHALVAGCEQESTFVWWCFFVNNQFRLLQDGETADTQSLLDVFAKPLESAGKVLMCMDKFKECSYTRQIWCIFEVFSAVRRSIPITLIMPEQDLDEKEMAITSLKDLTQTCSIDAAQAKCPVKELEDLIKAHILKTMGSFAYVNQQVEQALWVEVIKVLNEARPSGARPSSARASSVSTSARSTGMVEFTSSSSGTQVTNSGCMLQ